MYLLLIRLILENLYVAEGKEDCNIKHLFLQPDYYHGINLRGKKFHYRINI